MILNEEEFTKRVMNLLASYVKATRVKPNVVLLDGYTVQYLIENKIVDASEPQLEVMAVNEDGSQEKIEMLIFVAAVPDGTIMLGRMGIDGTVPGMVMQGPDIIQ